MAFDQYYAMGAKRELKGLAGGLKGAEEFKHGVPAWKTLKKWSAANNWQERCKQRDIENSRKVQEQTDKSVVNSMADHRKMIKELLEQDSTLDGYAITLIGTAFDLITEGTLKVETIKELVELMRVHQGSIGKKVDLMKADLLLMGEPDSRNETTIRIIDVLREGRTKNVHSG